MNDQKGKGRLLVFLAIALCMILVLVGRYAYLMLFLPGQHGGTPITIPDVERGPILDRNGKILAITTALQSVGVWVPDLEDVEETAHLLSEILNLEEEDILDTIVSTDGFAFIKRKATPTQSNKVKALMEEGKLRGIKLGEEFGRNYPLSASASHLIGYVGTDNVGLDGIEHSFNSELSPSDLGKGIDRVYGNQVFLTIDANAQFAVESIAREALITNNAESVIILVMGAQTGEILAYVSLPDFDPNNYPSNFTEYDASSLVNRPIRSAYEPGSVFKIFSISSFLELGGIDFDDTFFCDGNYPDVVPPIHDLRPHGEVNARNILKYSCNVGAAYASETVTADGFYTLLRRFGFGKRTGIALTGENPGSLKESTKWSGRTKPTIAFGQELNVNAVQMISAATVFCNRGILLKPLVVKKIVAPDGKLIKRYNRQEVAEVLSPEIAGGILSMMESATDEGGTARLARIEGIRISAKTGTAQIFDAKKGKYLEDRHIASFLGILPASDPQLIVYVVINSPQVELDYGSRVAAPVFKETAERLITLMGLSDSRIIEHSGRVLVPELEGIVVGKHMPDLTGMPKRKLLSLLTRDDIKVLFKGEGYVVRQKPNPGEPVDPGMTLILEFE